MNRKLLLAGAAVVALLGISVPLAYSGKLVNPQVKQAEQAVSATSGGSQSTAAGQWTGGSATGAEGTRDGAAAGQAQTGQNAGASAEASTGQTGTQPGAAAGTQPGAAAGLGPSTVGGQSAGTGISGSGQNGGAAGTNGGSANTSGSTTGTSGSGQTAPTPPTVTVPEPAALKVEVTIIGKSGETLYGPTTVSIPKDNKWGETVMGALHATGVPYRMHSTYTTMVVNIAGQANSGMTGWMYKVNGQPGNQAASDKKVSPGDKIVWWYSI